MDALAILTTGAAATVGTTASVIAIPLDGAGMLPKYVRVTSSAPVFVRPSLFGQAATQADALVIPGDAAVLSVGGMSVISALSLSGSAQVSVSPVDVGGWQSPDKVPALDLIFSGATSLDSRVTFSRASTATYTGSDGLLHTAAANAPRFDYSPTTLAPLGLLIEESRTNLLTYSQDFSNAAWSKFGGATLVANNATAPDGTQTASTLTFGTGTSSSLYRTSALGLASAAYTLSGWLRSDTAGTCLLDIYDGSNDHTSANLAVSTTWQRFSITYTGSVANVSLLNSSAGGVNVVQVYGLQLEAGSTASTYIPTTSAAVTRAADVCSIATNSFGFNAAQGTFVAQFDSLSGVAKGAGVFGAAGLPAMGVNQISGTVSSSIRTVVALISGTTNSYSPGSAAKAAMTYRSGASLLCLAAGSVASSAATFSPLSAGSVYLGYDQVSGSAWINGHISRLTYYPRALSAAQLQGMTA